MKTSKVEIISVVVAIIFVLVAMTSGYLTIGLPPVVIVGGSGVIALLMWFKTYLRKPLDPQIILPIFLLTVAALEIHMQMGRSFPICLTTISRSPEIIIFQECTRQFCR